MSSLRFVSSRPSTILTALSSALLLLTATTAFAGHHEGGNPHAPAIGQVEKAAEKTAKAGAEAAKEKARSVALDAPHLANEMAPEKFRVRFETTRGDVVLAVTRAWSPHGADRFYNLVKIGYYEDIAFFRVIPGFMAQFGMHGDPAVTRKWQTATIKDDPVVQSNLRGYVTFAKTGRPNSRTTQLFINLSDNVGLDRQGFSPFAQVVEGMEVVDQIFKIGEGAPRGPGPNQMRIKTGGNAYLKKSFPKLDYLKRATLID